MNKEDQKAVLEAVLELSTPLKKVSVGPRNVLEKILSFIGLYKAKTIMLILDAISMRTNYKLTYLMLDLVPGDNSGGDIEQILNVINANSLNMATIVATAIHNQNSKTPTYLINAILDGFSNAELKIAIKEIYRRLDVQSFFDSMALLRTLSLLESTPDQSPLGQ